METRITPNIDRAWKTRVRKRFAKPRTLPEIFGLCILAAVVVCESNFTTDISAIYALSVYALETHVIFSNSKLNYPRRRTQHRGNRYVTSLPLVSGSMYWTSLAWVSVRHHGRVLNSVKIEINFTSRASSTFLVHNLCCDKSI